MVDKVENIGIIQINTNLPIFNKELL